MAGASSTPTLRLEDVSFQYPGSKHPVVSIANFSVAPGEKIFLRGKSGSGKSTLLNLVAGVLTPQKGRIQVLGKMISSLSASERDRFRGAKLGLIFQQFNLIPYLTARENILLPTRLMGLPRTEERLEALATGLGLGELLDRKPIELSVGQQQRVAVARALYHRPELLIADEPTSALDHEARDQFLALLLRECENTRTTVLYVSHDPTLSKSFDRAVELSEINS